MCSPASPYLPAQAANWRGHSSGVARRRHNTGRCSLPVLSSERSARGLVRRGVEGGEALAASLDGKLWHSTSLSQLKQLYYTLIYPYISYAITSWDGAFTTQIKNIQTKQNHVIRLMFFATLYGPDIDSALPLLNLLDLLTVKYIYKLKPLNFTHQWHLKKITKYIQPAFSLCKWSPYI